MPMYKVYVCTLHIVLLLCAIHATIPVYAVHINQVPDLRSTTEITAITLYVS